MKKIIKVFSQTFWQLLGKGITSITTLFILSFISRNFGPEEVGRLTLALTYIGFFSLTVDLGLNGYLLPLFLEKDFEKEWRRLFGLRIILSILSITFAYCLVLFWRNDPEFRQLIFIGAFFAILSQAVFTSVSLILQSKLRYDLTILSTSLGYAGVLAAAFFVSQKGLDLPFFMASYVLGWVLIIIISLSLSLKYIKNILPLFDFKYIKNIFKNSWPISATLILNLIYFRLDAFLISFYRGFAEVGIYNLSYQVFQSALVLPVFIMNGYYPLMVTSLKENKKVFIQEFKKATVLMLFIGLLAAIVSFIFGDILIKILSGEKGFSDSVVLLKILSTGFPLFFASALFMWVLVTIKEYKNLVKIYFAGLCFNCILNIILIPQFSYWGASVTTIFSEGLILLLQTILIRKRLF